MKVTLTLDLNDVNTALEGLQRVQDNAARVAFQVRDQATIQVQDAEAKAQAQEDEAKAKAQAAQQAAQEEAVGAEDLKA